MRHKIRQNVIIDTDPGHDDALAIMLMVKSGLFDVKALTTVPGNSSIENVTRNAAYILDLLRRRDIPIYSGKGKPLHRELIKAVVHGESGLDGVDVSKTKFVLSADAEDQIIKMVKEERKMTLLTLGPLTNIARAFQKHKSLPQKIDQIVMMAGAVNVPGNKNRVAEFNMFVDPEAADVVFRADVKKTMIPIDACNDMPVFMEDFEKLRGADIYKPIMGMMEKFIAGIAKYEGTKGALVYDAVAAYYLVNPAAFTIEPMDIVMETKGEHTFGMTIAEKRLGEKKHFNIDVVTKVDRKRFIRDFLAILKQ